MANNINEKPNINNWIRCSNCNHKLMRVIDTKDNNTVIEIKCSSCKAITKIKIEKR